MRRPSRGRWMRASGYEGAFSVEVEQRPDAATAVRASFATVAPILRACFGWEGRA